MNTPALRPFARRRGAFAAAVALFVYVGVFLTMNLADKLVLYPQTGRLDAPGAERRVVGEGRAAIEIWASRSRPQEEPAGYALRFYGNADRAEHWITSEARSYARQSIELWGVNYPGYGGSGGAATLAGVARSAGQSFDAMARVAGTKPVFVIGTSLGTTAALHVAATRPVAGCVLQNPPALRELIVGDHGWWNLWLLAFPISRQIPRELDSIRNAASAKAPAIFISAESDEIVATKYQRMVIDAYAGSKRVFLIPGARHNDPLPPAIDAQFHAAFSEMFSRVAAR